MRSKALRQARGVSQAALAETVGSSHVDIAWIEGSATRPPTRTPSLPGLEKLATTLQGKPGRLLE